MKKLLLVFPLLLILTVVGVGAQDKGEDSRLCQRCGMDRTIYANSCMLIVYADETRVGTCSLHCTAAELKEHSGKKVKSLLVADYFSKKLIDARKAAWVIGGSKSGVMTATPKWAFAGKGSAERFIAANGGKLAGFDEALTVAKKE